jgi:glycerophosphoryl diester phosphodiesterase
LFTKIFAHRGASQFAPENTMAAFELASELGAEGIETDVHLTKDLVPVLIHDEHLKRTTNGSGYVKDYTFNELKQFDAGSWFSEQFSGTRIISLEDFLQWSKPKPLSLNIELKNNKITYQYLETIVYEMIDHYELRDRTILSTFNVNSVKRMKTFADIEVALLTSKNSKNLVPLAKEIGANALHIKYRLLKAKLMKQAKQENIAVRVYTVNKRIQMMRCFAHHCDGIFTDVPNLGLKYRKFFL